MKGWLLDMDGVLYRGNAPIPGALAFLEILRRRRIPYLLVTNHSCLTPSGFARKLARMGIRVPARRIYSSAEATAEWLAARGIRKVFLIGEEGLRVALRRHGIALARRAARCVVVGLDRRLDYDRLTEACRLIARGALFVGTNPDPSYPIEGGLAPECGALLAAIERVTGRKPVVMGKPEPAMFRQAARRLGVPIRQCSVIGDRLDTDILGARRAGARAILVLTGHTTRALLRRSPLRPDGVAATLGTISGEL